MHKKHSDLTKASLGNFSRNEIAFLGTPCSELHDFFHKIISKLNQYQFAIVEADHKAEETISPHIAFTDKINFNRLDTNQKLNKFEMYPFFEATDLTLVNGNHFEASKQIIFIDAKKPLEKKLDKLKNVVLIIAKDQAIPQYILDHFGESLPPILNEKEEDKIIQFIENQIIKSKPPLFGLVLSGGKSSRMGRDKANIKYHGELTQIEYTKKILTPFCENIFISLNPNRKILEDKDISNFDIIYDSFLDIGPLSGILSAFKKHPDAAWLTVACDMPFLTEQSIAQLVENRNTTKIATAFKSPENEFPEPLITIWEPKAFPRLLQMLAYGYDCPRKTLINSDIQLIDNQSTNELKNINTIEEFEHSIIEISPKIA